MLISKSDAARGGMAGLAIAAGLSVIVIPVLVWKSDHAPEFFGAFAAAIVAAIAVMLGAFYQAELTRQRDEALRTKERLASAVDLCLWLNHCVFELEFVADFLEQSSSKMAAEEIDALLWPIERLRQILSAPFMNELTARAKSASQLPMPLAVEISAVLYRAASEADRVHNLRGVSDTFRPTMDWLNKHEQLVRARVESLREAYEHLRQYLVAEKAW